ncbi:MAG: AAA family ATPase, partial [Planctomycetes bacterium]|nr:AAA family ATPase [Planctomycetota bacterium]
EIRVVNLVDSGRVVTINGESVDSWVLSDRYGETDGKPERGSARKYLPSHIFTYYSGKSERLEALFRDHQDRFIDNLSDYEDEIDSDLPLRRLFYCRHPHSKLVLLACLLAPEKPLKDILHDLRIEDVDSVLFSLKKPYRLSGELPAGDIKAGDNRFWYDRTRFTEELLSKLWELATAPIDHTEEKTVDFRGRTEPQDLLYLYLMDKDALTQLKDHVGDTRRLFQYVEGSYIADLLDDVRIFVKHKNADDLIAFEQLSEGELQLLTVLGLMRLTHQDECLFLLDEPDTHLNPIWKLRYFDEIERVLKQDDAEILKGDSQIIVTTHDPMLIGSLRKEQVRILRNHADHTEVTTPNDHPQGMGVAGLLKSDMFGLPSTLDRQTLEMLQERNKLISLRANGALTEQQTIRLERLSSVLDDLGFAHAYRDPLYQKFIELMYATRGRPLDELFSPEEFKEHEQVARRIVEELIKREKTDELSDLAKELHLEVQS